MTVLDHATDQATAFGSFHALVRACRTGYVPSLRSSNSVQQRVGFALGLLGLAVFWG